MATFSPAVERWRPYVKKYSPGWPVDYVLAWIKRESGGGASKGGWFTSMDERGVLQIHPATAKDLGIVGDDWAFLNEFPGYPAVDGFDFDRHYRLSAQMLNYYGKLAVAKLEEANARFEGRDFFAVVKLLHGLPAIVSQGLKAFIAAKGRAPATWAEWVGWIRSTGWSYGSWDAVRVSEIIGNAEKVAGFAPAGRLGVLAVILAVGIGAGLGWWAWRRWGRSGASGKVKSR